LHNQGVVHRDIKGANILLKKNGDVKLADFGISSKLSDLQKKKNAEVVGTPYWMAPEVIRGEGVQTVSDIWSLGCTIVELLTGKPPYYNLNQMQAMYHMASDANPPIPQGISASLKDFLNQCFLKDPNLRVPAKQLVQHPWIRMGIKERRRLQEDKKNQVDTEINKYKNLQKDVRKEVGVKENSENSADFDSTELSKSISSPGLQPFAKKLQPN